MTRGVEVLECCGVGGRLMCRGEEAVGGKLWNKYMG